MQIHIQFNFLCEYCIVKFDQIKIQEQEHASI